MATWSEIDNFLEGNGFKKNGNLWSGVVKVSDNRSQVAIIGRYDFEGDDADMIRVLSPFAKTSDISAEQALSQANLFGVCSTGEFYCFTDTIPIQDADGSDIVTTVALLSVFADKAEQAFGTHDSM
jgi:hypothetical protein